MFKTRAGAGGLLSWCHEGRVRDEYRLTPEVLAHTIESLVLGPLPQFVQGHAGEPFPSAPIAIDVVDEGAPHSEAAFDVYDDPGDGPAPTPPTATSPDRIEFSRHISLGRNNAPTPHRVSTEARLRGLKGDPTHIETVDPPHREIPRPRAARSGPQRRKTAFIDKFIERQCAFAGPESDVAQAIRKLQGRTTRKWLGHALACFDQYNRTS